jgi:UDP-2,4-diacetamido-2,4,6-trideoxy-beta-L-altropyranose hydrolase
MKFLVRADASTAIGVGHVMRCLALAQAWQDQGGTALFAMAEGGEALGGRLKSENIAVAPISAAVNSAEDARQTLELAEKQRVDWIVLDGYRFDAEYQRRLKEGSGRLMALDDSGQAHFYWADLVLNQNAHAAASFYPLRLPSTRLLLGLEYALLRREFYSRPRALRGETSSPHHLLVTFGGGDPENLTGRVLAALKTLDAPDLEVLAVIGDSNPHRRALEKLVGSPRLKVCLRTGVKDMGALYAWADLALSGGGSTLWELAYMGVPALVLILADNQEPSSKLLDRLGSVHCLGRPRQLTDQEILDTVAELIRDSERRRRMAVCGQSLVDGRGGERVVRKMVACSEKERSRCTTY